MKVLVACEYSGTVREAFRKLGHDAWSCDILASDIPNNHYQCSIEEVLYQDWDLLIAHPPCTWLCQAMRTNAARKDRPKISAIFSEERQKAFDFVSMLYTAPIEKIAIENPIGYLNTALSKPTQIIRPWMFGHEYSKDVCLWLKGLPRLVPTNIIDGPYKKLDFWSNKRNPDGRSLKSKTFQGIANAMAEQWGKQ